jgi:hypothetical protein
MLDAIAEPDRERFVVIVTTYFAACHRTSPHGVPGVGH